MAFKINQPDTFRWPVRVALPKDGGGFETGTFDAIFKRLPRSEAEDMGNRVISGELSGVDAVRSILVGWQGVTDGPDEVAYSEANRERLLEVTGVAVAVFRAYTDANSGAAQAKN